MEPKYPIYRISAKWSYKRPEGRERIESLDKDLPDDRSGNAVSFTKMFKEPKTQEEIDLFAQEWWQKYTEAKLKDSAPELLELKGEYVEDETWHLTWFQHETFDYGQTDKEALASFEAFVQRKEQLNLEHRRKGHAMDAYCLMGAEDRYRWTGGESDNRTPPPCRCEHCKKQGLLRIGH
jgi:hypothetical protein